MFQVPQQVVQHPPRCGRVLRLPRGLEGCQVGRHLLPQICTLTRWVELPLASVRMGASMHAHDIILPWPHTVLMSGAPSRGHEARHTP